MEAGVRVLRSFRSWVLYAAAWLPYAVSYFLIFRIEYPPDVLPAVRALCYVVPAALLGVLVIRFAQRLPWSGHRRRSFLPVHVAAAVVYSIAWWSGIRLSEYLLYGILRHQWTAGDWGGYAGQWQTFAGLMIYGNIIGFCYVMQAQRSYAEAEALRARAVLQALRSQ